MSSEKKLAVAGTVVIAATMYMAYLGATAGWQYYLTAEECLANARDLAGNRLRVSGRIVSGTLRISAGRDTAEFALAAPQDRLRVVCRGPLPDNLAEASDVVVEGRLDENGLLRGDKVLTRCASKYESQAEEKGAGSSETMASRRRENRR
jgi:cytochrome c-type biogenesis protein CcmE